MTLGVIFAFKQVTLLFMAFWAYWLFRISIYDTRHWVKNSRPWFSKLSIWSDMSLRGLSSDSVKRRMENRSHHSLVVHATSAPSPRAWLYLSFYRPECKGIAENAFVETPSPCPLCLLLIYNCTICLHTSQTYLIEVPASLQHLSDSKVLAAVVLQISKVKRCRWCFRRQSWAWVK